MTRKLSLYAFFVLIASAFIVACNDSEDTEYYSDILNPGGNIVEVDSFKLVANDSILKDLDKVFFSIDLERAMIYNADSLPKGTKVSALKIDMGVGEASKADITMPNSVGEDTVVNFLEDSTEPINFSRGYVTLHLESYNKEHKRDYKIYVNVHKMDPDTMVWDKLSATKLPSTLSSIEAQRTVEHKGMVLCFTKQAENYCLMTTETPTGNWAEKSINLPAGARVESITSGTTKLFLTDSNDNLFESTDMGESWSSVNTKMSHIYGCLDDKAIGVRNDNGSYKYVTYPATTEVDVPNGYPVKATSQTMTYTTEWSTSPFMITAGGLDANGNAVSGVWGYDGSNWSKTSISGLPALEAPVIVPYYTIKGEKFWSVTKSSVLFAMGGRTAENYDNPIVYISFDFGVHWSKAPKKLQLPESFRPGSYAQAFVFESELSSRASAPITQWDCPYVYVFGGLDAQGTLNTNIYRGVINRLSFKPLQ